MSKITVGTVDCEVPFHSGFMSLCVKFVKHRVAPTSAAIVGFWATNSGAQITIKHLLTHKRVRKIHTRSHTQACTYTHGAHNKIKERSLLCSYPSVVIVTMVYQKEAGMLVNLLELEPFSA